VLGDGVNFLLQSATGCATFRVISGKCTQGPARRKSGGLFAFYARPTGHAFKQRHYALAAMVSGRPNSRA
jgi:hypothetical protein